jgi:hypothetical protein
MQYIHATVTATFEVPKANPGVVLRAYLALVWNSWAAFASCTPNTREQVVDLYLDGQVFPDWPMR